MPSQIQLLRYRYLIFVDGYSYASNNQITFTATLNVSQSINSSKLLAYVYTFSSSLNGTNFFSFSSLVGFHLKSTGSNLYDVGVETVGNATTLTFYVMSKSGQATYVNTLIYSSIVYNRDYFNQANFASIRNLYY